MHVAGQVLERFGRRGKLPIRDAWRLGAMAKRGERIVISTSVTRNVPLRPSRIKPEELSGLMVPLTPEEIANMLPRSPAPLADAVEAALLHVQRRRSPAPSLLTPELLDGEPAPLEPGEDPGPTLVLTPAHR